MLSIMLLTVALTLATAPLTFLAMRSQRRLAALQPEVERLRRSFGNDGQRLAQETTALFKAKRVSPFGGCLPILIQAPLFLAMFRHVQNVAADGLRFGPVDLAQTGVAALHAGPASALLLVGLLAVMIGASLIQMWSTPTPAQAEPVPGLRVARYLPLAFSASVLALPLALGVYYATSSVVRLAVHWAVNRQLST